MKATIHHQFLANQPRDQLGPTRHVVFRSHGQRFAQCWAGNAMMAKSSSMGTSWRKIVVKNDDGVFWRFLDHWASLPTKRNSVATREKKKLDGFFWWFKSIFFGAASTIWGDGTDGTPKWRRWINGFLWEIISFCLPDFGSILNNFWKTAKKNC